MPNTTPPVWNGETVLTYDEQIKPHLGDCRPHILAKMLTATTPETVREVYKAGAVGFKVYPEGVTTNAHDGTPHADLVRLLYSPRKNSLFLQTIAEIERLGMVLSFHGEIENVIEEQNEILERESNFLQLVPYYLQAFSKLRIVLEHITTKEAVEKVREWHRWAPGRIAATITPHHLQNSLDNLLAGKLRPHLYCMPVVKYKRDQKALVEAAIKAEGCFFLGSDTAPHEISKKECDEGCAGVFNSPCLLESVWEAFNPGPAIKGLDEIRIERFEKFVSRNGRNFYGLLTCQKRTRLVKESWTVPDSIHEFRPYRAGETLGWKAVSI
jgi:dihydroorotase